MEHIILYFLKPSKRNKKRFLCWKMPQYRFMNWTTYSLSETELGDPRWMVRHWWKNETRTSSGSCFLDCSSRPINIPSRINDHHFFCLASGFGNLAWKNVKSIFFRVRSRRRQLSQWLFALGRKKNRWLSTAIARNNIVPRFLSPNATHTHRFFRVMFWRKKRPVKNFSIQFCINIAREKIAPYLHLLLHRERLMGFFFLELRDELRKFLCAKLRQVVTVLTGKWWNPAFPQNFPGIQGGPRNVNNHLSAWLCRPIGHFQSVCALKATHISSGDKRSGAAFLRAFTTKCRHDSAVLWKN